MEGVKGAIARVKKGVTDFINRIKNFNLNKKFTEKVTDNIKGLMKGTVSTKEIRASFNKMSENVKNWLVKV